LASKFHVLLSMTFFNHEGQPEGDWDDRGNISWSELDWQQFLLRQEKEVAQFLSYYDECPSPAMERLDWVARQMGWEADDWSVGDFIDEDEDSAELDSDPAGERDLADADPYTLHRHPVFVVSTGLFIQVRYIWRGVLDQRLGVADGLPLWDFAESLNEAEKHSLMGMQCMDMGDFLLCVVHLKRSLRGLNLAMGQLPGLAQLAGCPTQVERALMSRLFDLREVFLRVVRDCREEESRDFRD